MKKLFLTLAAGLLMLMAFQPSASAQSYQAFGAQEILGTWTFFVTIDGAPTCQCIVIARLRADGTMDGPGNDQLSSAALGEWERTAYRQLKFALLQNNINPDGTAGGETVIRGTMNLNGTADAGTGTSTFQLLDVTGAVVSSGTATFQATKLKLD